MKIFLNQVSDVHYFFIKKQGTLLKDHLIIAEHKMVLFYIKLVYTEYNIQL